MNMANHFPALGIHPTSDICTSVLISLVTAGHVLTLNPKGQGSAILPYAQKEG